MKRILTAAALLLVVAACNKDENYNDKYGDRAVIPPKGQSLRVMTYNIYGARATSPANAADLDAIAEVIRRQNPDFVTLNEVDVFTNRTGKDVHQARDLAEKLGMEWHFSKAIDRDGGEYGDAVLSKYPILEKRSYRLPCAAEHPFVSTFGISGKSRPEAVPAVVAAGIEAVRHIRPDLDALHLRQASLGVRLPRKQGKRRDDYCDVLSHGQRT